MDLKFWIWLIIIGASLVGRLLKKRPEQPKPVIRPSTAPHHETVVAEREERHTPVTFEELLKEIQGSKIPDNQTGLPKYDFEDYDDETIRSKKAKPIEDTGYDYRQHDTIYGIYDEQKQLAFERPSLEETMKLEDTIVRFDTFKNYQKEAPPAFTAYFAREIRTQDGFKRAFIMNEIMQRRF